MGQLPSRARLKSPSGHGLGTSNQWLHTTAGPSFHAGLTVDEKPSNPLKQVLDVLGEKVECATYDQVGQACPACGRAAGRLWRALLLLLLLLPWPMCR